MAEMRRWVTIVFSDITGSTALAERLEPETVRNVVAARSGELPANAVALLRVSAELGQSEFSYDMLAAVLPARQGELITALDAALGSGLLVEHGARYAFGHPLYRLAVESSSGTPTRADTHLGAAAVQR